MREPLRSPLVVGPRVLSVSGFGRGADKKSGFSADMWIWLLCGHVDMTTQSA